MNEDALLSQINHRPFALPDSPWVMRQTWKELLFAHWRVSQEELAPFIPKQLSLDCFDGSAWIGVVPFIMHEVYPRYTRPLPWFSYFLELNVRTYVTYEGLSGVYFFSLDCSNPLAVLLARKWYHLPYFDAKMSLEKNGDAVRYSSHRAGRDVSLEIDYRPLPQDSDYVRDDLDIFLTERYCLYTTDQKSRLYRGVIHHLPWPLQKAEADIRVNSMIARQLPLAVPKQIPHLRYSKELPTIEWALTPLPVANNL